MWLFVAAGDCTPEAASKAIVALRDAGLAVSALEEVLDSFREMNLPPRPEALVAAELQLIGAGEERISQLNRAGLYTMDDLKKLSFYQFWSACPGNTPALVAMLRCGIAFTDAAPRDLLQTDIRPGHFPNKKIFNVLVRAGICSSAMIRHLPDAYFQSSIEMQHIGPERLQTLRQLYGRTV